MTFNFKLGCKISDEYILWHRNHNTEDNSVFVFTARRSSSTNVKQFFVRRGKTDVDTLFVVVPTVHHINWPGAVTNNKVCPSKVSKLNFQSQIYHTCHLLAVKGILNLYSLTFSLFKLTEENINTMFSYGSTESLSNFIDTIKSGVNLNLELSNQSAPLSKTIITNPLWATPNKTDMYALENSINSLQLNNNTIKSCIDSSNLEEVKLFDCYNKYPRDNRVIFPTENNNSISAIHASMTALSSRKVITCDQIVQVTDEWLKNPNNLNCLVHVQTSRAGYGAHGNLREYVLREFIRDPSYKFPVGGMRAKDEHERLSQQCCKFIVEVLERDPCDMDQARLRMLALTNLFARDFKLRIFNTKTPSKSWETIFFSRRFGNATGEYARNEHVTVVFFEEEDRWTGECGLSQLMWNYK